MMYRIHEIDGELKFVQTEGYMWSEMKNPPATWLEWLVKLKEAGYDPKLFRMERP